MLDFSDATDQEELKELNSEEIKKTLHNRLKEVLLYLFPHGKIRRDQFTIGDVHGSQGDSLCVELSGPKIGLWHDFATGEGGDIFTLWGAAKGLNSHNDFPEIIDSIQNWLGTPQYHIKKIKSDYTDNLGASTQRWDYTDAHGDLIACVYRYDTPAGKEYRPWDVKARKHRAPDPRPLYNQLAIKNADEIILVEGEKCADALISQGFCATTAIGGANAPVDKTDWTPLAGKHVIIWPDNDQAGLKYAEALKNKLSTICRSLAIINPPSDKPKGWDAADAAAEGMDIQNFIKINTKTILQNTSKILLFESEKFLDDHSPMQDDIISPRILTPKGLLVFGGAPKVGKTDFLLNCLAHMAAGIPFLEMTPSRPLKILYLQAELEYDYIRERLKKIKLKPEALALMRKNLIITPALEMLLDEKGIEEMYAAILGQFNPSEIDIIVIDPLRNFYDGDNENDNIAMRNFIQNRVKRLRNMINPDAGIILVHHTKKINKKMIEEDPFQSLSGASSLRGLCTSCVLLFRPNEQESLRKIFFEFRYGPFVPSKLIDKIDNVWQEIEDESERLVKQSYGEILDSERQRKHDVILQLIYDKARKGSLYTPTQFAQNFENKAGLGSKHSIMDRIDVLTTKGYIKFNKDNVERSKFGFMVTEGMEVPIGEEIVNQDTGELSKSMQLYPPTHFKEPSSGAILPVENPSVWVYQDS